MDLLKDGVAMGLVVPTELSRKLTIDGITKAYPVYKIRLDILYYNDQNDRIATWISQYKSQHDGQSPHISNGDMYNDVIEDFIVKSNPTAIAATQNNIELVDQREPGVVLVDGRIIDGNRRFTCLRRLSNKNDRFKHFEAVILEHNIESSAKQIKMLELSIQHGEESKIDYNPIDRLVGIFNDIIDTKLLSVSEYAKSTNEPESDVRKRMEITGLMTEFLDFINAPKQFHIARDLQIGFPLEELAKLLKKCKSVDETEDLKICVFTNILMKTSNDLGRFVRNIKDIVTSNYMGEFIDEQKEIAYRVVDNLPPKGSVNEKLIREVIRANDEVAQELEQSMEKALTKAKKTETRNRPIQLIEKATTFLEDIDMNILHKFNDSELQRVERQLAKLDKIIDEIRGNLDV
ncbi:hypothetical protein BSK59_28770 [Paenibacillus odorifer]|uniref:hypothetical protein n=1 Tax=Paenibacillus odorifer TaxID=189426 RepID=UPI00096DA644|nr:hypothetical protein [Paenibacillus odorifer]OME46840.1 hypothetical protein BSK59_28770 [Paenibacillus odorifer]